MERQDSLLRKLVRSVSLSSKSNHRRRRANKESAVFNLREHDPDATDVLDGEKERGRERERKMAADGEKKVGSKGVVSARPQSYFPAPPPQSPSSPSDSSSPKAPLAPLSYSSHPESIEFDPSDDISLSPPSRAAAPGVQFAPARGLANGTERQLGRDRDPRSSTLEPWKDKLKRSTSNSSRAGRGDLEVVTQGVQTGGAQTSRGTTARRGGRTRAATEPTSERKEYLAPPMPSTRSRSYELTDPAAQEKTGAALARQPSLKLALERVGFAMPPLKPRMRGEEEKRVLVLVADGCEEIEVVTVMDVLVRASCVPVLVSLSPLFSPSQSLPYVTLSRGLKIVPDTRWETLAEKYRVDFDAVVIPGGAKGAERLSLDPEIQSLLQEYYAAGKVVAFICAGPIAAKNAGIGHGRRITSHPSVRGVLEKYYDYREDTVVVDGNLVSR